jgi:hypothetical protein
MRYWLTRADVAGVGGLAELVDGDVLQPVPQVGGQAALGSDDGDAAVAGGGLLGELDECFLAGGAVDADALAGVAGGEDVAGGFPAAVGCAGRRCRRRSPITVSMAEFKTRACQNM